MTCHKCGSEKIIRDELMSDSYVCWECGHVQKSKYEEILSQRLTLIKSNKVLIVSTPNNHSNWMN